VGQGLQVWDENGVNLVDTDYRLTQIIGSVYTADLLANDAYMNGNIHVPEFASASGTPFVHGIPYNEHIMKIRYPNPSNSGYAPIRASSVRIEGNYVKWIYETRYYSNGNPWDNQRDIACLITWGVY